MKIKRFFPFENFILQTKLSPADVLSRVSNSIEPRKNFQFSFFSVARSKPYEGKIFGSNFEINRIIYYRNSFLPVIRGTIYTYLDRTEIKITMRPTVFVIVFMSFWLGTVGLVCVAMIIVALTQLEKIFQGGVSLFAFIPIGMFIVGAAMIVVGFKTESKKAEQFLTELFEASYKQAG